jgi:hypothetical protein
MNAFPIGSGTILLLAVGCAGGPFESGRSAGSSGSTNSVDTGAAGVDDARGTGDGGSPVLAASGTGGSGGVEDSGGTGGAGRPPVEALQPCGVAWTARAFAGQPALAVDGDVSTSWTSGEPRDAGQWLEIDGTAKLGALELLSPNKPNDLPGTLLVELDGVATATTSTKSAGALRVAFSERLVHSVRLVLDRGVEGGASSWWTVAEITTECAP